MHVAVCSCSLNFLIIHCCCPSCFAPGTLIPLTPHPVELFHPPHSLSLSLSSPLPFQLSPLFIMGSKRGEERAAIWGGWGWGERAREDERRGREGCWDGKCVREKGKWLYACVSGSSTPPDRFNVGAIDSVSCEGELIYSVLWRHTHWLYENSSRLFPSLNISTPSSWSAVVFKNVLMSVCAFPFGGVDYFFFPKIKATGPRLTPLHFACLCFLSWI